MYMMGSVIAWISQFAFLFIGLAGFIFVLAQADGADRPIARYRATIMLICSLSAGLSLSLPTSFLKWDTLPTLALSGSALIIALLVNVGLVAWISTLFFLPIREHDKDRWIWLLLLVSNIGLTACLCLILAPLQIDWVTPFVLTMALYAAAFWQIAISGFLFQQVIVERE